MLKHACVALVLATVAFGSTVSARVDFDRTALMLEPRDVRTVVSLPGCVPAWEVGAPAVPISVVHFVLPRDMKVTGATVTALETEPVDGEFDVYPVQPAVPLSAEVLPDFVPPDPQYYSSTPYPANVVTAGKQGSMFGYNVIGVFVAPVRYVGETRKLSFVSKVAFDLELEPADLGYLRPGGRSPEAVRRIESQLASFVRNPEDIAACAP